MYVEELGLFEKVKLVKPNVLLHILMFADVFTRHFITHLNKR